MQLKARVTKSMLFDPVVDSAATLRTSRALMATVHETRNSLRHTFDETMDRITRSKKLIRETDETIRKWNAPAAADHSLLQE
jgi:hypothetical protein